MNMKRISIFTLLFFSLITASFSISTVPDSIKKKIDVLVDTQILSPLKKQKEKLSLSDFSRAYGDNEVYVYDIYTEPSGKENFYLCVLKKMKGAFITEKTEFRLELSKKKVNMFSKKQKKFISVEQWLIEHEEEEQKSK